jgi:hypothetical protein
MACLACLAFLAFLAFLAQTLHPFPVVVKSDGVGASLSILTFHLFLASAESDGLKFAYWHKLSIHFRHRLNPMGCKKLAWYKSYIHFRSETNPMVLEKLV